MKIERLAVAIEGAGEDFGIIAVRDGAPGAIEDGTGAQADMVVLKGAGQAAEVEVKAQGAAGQGCWLKGRGLDPRIAATLIGEPALGQQV